MKISLIAAMADNGIIGIENRLPWKLPNDMKWFRQHSLGKPVIMGRKTLESFGGRTLPDRPNIVITRDLNYKKNGVIVTHSIEEALSAASDAEEAMIIGGASFYEQMLPQAEKFYLTEVHADIDGDASFPEFDRSQWQETHREDFQPDEKHEHAYSFVILERSKA